MALTMIRKCSDLGTAYILAPERYDPRRDIDAQEAGKRVEDVAKIVRNTVQPTAELGCCLVLDTGDAREGIVISRTRPKEALKIGSAKKTIQPGDVIISRLRPYLRQAAYVDKGILHSHGVQILCSTEFFVLRSVDEQSIAFLVPFLLSSRVQEILGASQEGGHHPRFNDFALSTLPIPATVLDARDTTSRAIERSIALYRESEATIADAIRQAEETKVGQT